MRKIQVGQIFTIKGYPRIGIVANTFSFDDCNYVLLYPLSSAVYLAASDDFILACSDCVEITEPMMCEIWNPLVINSKQITKSMFVSTLPDDFMSLYKKFLYYRHLGLKSPELSIFTGPPIRSSSDVRLDFRREEFNLFSELRSSAVDKLIAQ